MRAPFTRIFLHILHLVTLLVAGSKAATVVRISSADSFSSFLNNVNGGTNYDGTTVLLDSDLSLSGVSAPIGKDKSSYFVGTFDGQGHVIRDLKISSSALALVGLFGYSQGLAIRNVVLDSSCSMASSFSTTEINVGGIIGYCYANSAPCNIENCVNMASVAATVANSATKIFLGGIAGYLESPKYKIYVKNCANYGAITKSGACTSTSFVGGIVGSLYNYKTSSQYKYVQNCLNYGTVTHKDSTNTLYAGGIAGYSRYTYIENCVSAGEISSSQANYVGGIVGYAEAYSHMNYCYCTDKLSGKSTGAAGTPVSLTNVFSYDSATFKTNESISIGEYTGDSLVDVLNAYADYYPSDNYSKWLLNKDSKRVSFTINKRSNPIVMSYRLILLPSLAPEGNLFFDGWYNDDEYENLLESFSVTGNKNLYGRFGENISYKITFNTKGGPAVEPWLVQFGAVVSLPTDLAKDGCSFEWWEDRYRNNVGFSFVMPAHSIALYAVWKCDRITSPDDFADFSKVVNSGTADFKGSTVFLASDLSLSSYEIEPIGKDAGNQFHGVFDGQGYVISGLGMTSYSERSGLFGYSEGLTIRNVVLDSSCSITSSYSGSNKVYTGGIIGTCYSTSLGCKIENNVNMARVTFGGKVSSDSYLYLGGVAGTLWSSYDVHVKNCANYGYVTHSGNSSNSFVGGIAGVLDGSGDKYIQNCLNHCAIMCHEIAANSLFVGGIAGYSTYAYIENCVSSGKIATAAPTVTCYAGTIVGQVHSYIRVIRCYYTSSVGVSSPYGTGTPTETTGTPSSASIANLALINSLNSQTTSSNGWSKWLLNANSKPVAFKMNDRKGFTISSQIILFPDFVGSDERAFSGWYGDASLASPAPSKVETDTTLYGMFCASEYQVSLDVNGGNASSLPPTHPMAIECNGAYGTLPSYPTRTGYTFVGWFTERDGGSKVASGDNVTNFGDHTLYAHWTINQYTLRFVFKNGAEDEVRVLDFNQEVVYPANPEREGYAFKGWDKSGIEFMPACNLTITARWASPKGKLAAGTTILIVVVVVLLCALVSTVVAFILVSLKRRSGDNDGGGIKRRRIELEKPLIEYGTEYLRTVVESEEEIEGDTPAIMTKSILSSLYKEDYTRPSLRDALLQAELPTKRADLVCSACESAARIIADEDRLFDEFTVDDAAAVAMYTYDFGPSNFEDNPYRIINRSLVGRNYAGLQKASGLLYLVVSALRKMPRVTGITLYRGVRGEVNASNYIRGKIVAWPALSSTSPDIEATKKFLAKGSKSGKATGTLFIIEGGWGYDIQPYSLFPGEAEILLEPERQFKVTGVLDTEGLTFVNLKMLDTPLSIPEVFGGD